jgi:predicted acylesterase/phospholipase RssA
MPPLKIQLALQGGGAKISTLMAVMEAIQKLEQEKLLKVVRVAGTSAGSLVGCLHAAGVKMETLRASLLAGHGNTLVSMFPPPKLRQMAWQLFSARPFWSTKSLEKGLQDLFKEKGVFKLGDLKKKTGTEVIVVAADLGTSDKVIYNDDKDDIVKAIINSCAIPYYFRTWDKGGRTGEVIVDGGICENLPSSELKETPDEPVVAVTFQPTRPGTPQDVRAFTLALLETAMNNSIDRAKRELKEDSIHIIKTDLTTFDFKRGLEYGLTDENAYCRAFERAEAFFRKFVEIKLKEQEANAAALKRMEQEALASKPARPEKQDIGGDLWGDQSPTILHIMKQISKVYEVQHAQNKFKYLRCTFAVQANCLLEEGETLYASPDWYSYRLTFQPMDEPIPCLSVALTPTPHAKFLGKTKWTVRDAANNIIESIDVPSRNPNFPGERELLLFFNPVMKPNSGPYSLLFQDEAMLLMEPLLNKKRDELAFYPRRAFGKIDRIDLLLHVPDRLKNAIQMESKGGAVPGRPMTKGELADYSVPFGFHTLGWTGENITVEDNFGVNLFYR